MWLLFYSGKLSIHLSLWGVLHLSFAAAPPAIVDLFITLPAGLPIGANLIQIKCKQIITLLLLLIRTCKNAAFLLCGGSGSAVNPLFKGRFETELHLGCFEQVHTEKLENSGAVHHVNVWAFDLVIRQPNTQFTVLKCRSNCCHFPSLLVGELVAYSLL